jgi:hypothetical protein
LTGAMMSDRFLLVKLFDVYEVLLTDNQRKIFDLYYFQDISLGEIAENMSISRQAVHDLLKRTEKILCKYESLLHLNQRFSLLLGIIQEIEASSQSKDGILAERLKEILFFNS